MSQDIPEGADPDVYAAYVDLNQLDGPEPMYRSYAEYVEDQVGNYEHLVRASRPEAHPDGYQAGLDEVNDLKYWLSNLHREHDRLFPLCGACGQFHPREPGACDLEPVVHVTIDVFVPATLEDPAQYVREWIANHPLLEGMTISDVFADEEYD